MRIWLKGMESVPSHCQSTSTLVKITHQLLLARSYAARSHSVNTRAMRRRSSNLLFEDDVEEVNAHRGSEGQLAGERERDPHSLTSLRVTCQFCDLGTAAVKGTAYPHVVRTQILYSSCVCVTNGAEDAGVLVIPIHLWGSN